MNFLEGLFKIALVRRIETLTSLGSIICSISVLIWSPTLLNLIIVNQLWILFNGIRDWYLCISVNGGLYKTVSKVLPFDKTIFLKIWRPAWRSGLSGLMSVGLTNLTGVVYAQLGDSNAVAAYLLAFRLINQIKEISMAPFYSKIPMLAMLRVKNDLDNFVKVVKRSMLLSHLVFVIGVVGVGVCFDTVLLLINSEVKFLSQPLWILISFAFFIHRFGAMHIQVYMSTNHIISHIADGISGILYILSSLVLGNYIGIYAIPVGMLIGYLGFYAWYAARYSYKSMEVTFIKFELRTSFIPLTIFLAYIIFIILKA